MFKGAMLLKSSKYKLNNAKNELHRRKVRKHAEDAEHKRNQAKNRGQWRKELEIQYEIAEKALAKTVKIKKILAKRVIRPFTPISHCHFPSPSSSSGSSD